jgi:hypothetical protein
MGTVLITIEYNESNMGLCLSWTFLSPILTFEDNRKGYAVLQEKLFRHKFLKYVALKLCKLYPFYILPYLLTPWSEVFLEKLTGSPLVKKFPGFY